MEADATTWVDTQRQYDRGDSTRVNDHLCVPRVMMQARPQRTRLLGEIVQSPAHLNNTTVRAEARTRVSVLNDGFQRVYLLDEPYII